MGEVLPLGAGSVNYSTNEQIVGTWIDGKPIYQKTVDCGAIPNATSKEIAHNISDLDMIIDIKGFAYSSTDGWISLPFTVSSSTSNYAVQVDVRKNNVIKVQCAANMSAFTSSYVTLQYTKTTD